MCKVYEFPNVKKLPKEVEECLHDIAEAYIKTINHAVTVMGVDISNEEEVNGVMELVVQSYAEGLCLAADKLEP